MAISLGLVMFYQKLHEADCTTGCPEGAFLLLKTESKCRFLFADTNLLCNLLLAFPSWMGNPENDLLWKGHRWIVLTSAETPAINSWKSAVYLALHVHFMYLNICSVSPLRDKICTLRGDLTLEQCHDRSPERMQNAMWKSTSVLSELYHFGLPCKDIHLLVAL